MNRCGTRSLVRAVCVAAVLALLAVPLSRLMIARETAQSTPVVSSLGDVTDDRSVSEAPTATSAVSALMAGSAVGPTAQLNLPRPASAFVP
jgi:hypothetical protein